jgi:uncharacterized membrane protein YoaK (UPF0700 family)
MQHSSTRPSDTEIATPGEQPWVAFLLAWVAGFSDAIGFLVLQQLGASFMSGNSMATGAALGHRDWSSALLHGVPILSFVLGIILGFLVRALINHWGIRSSFAVIFGLEALFILACLVLGSRSIHSLQGEVIQPFPARILYPCIAFLTLAMGLQTATLRRVNSQGVRTTFVTGVLSDWADALVQYLFWLHRQTTEQCFLQAVRASTQQVSFRNLLLLGGTWGCYVVGAICGGATELSMVLAALVFPLCVLVVLIVIDVLRPFER